MTDRRGIVTASLDAVHCSEITRRRVDRAVAQDAAGWWWEDRDGFAFGPVDTCAQAESAALANPDKLAPLPLEDLAEIELDVFA